MLYRVTVTPSVGPEAGQAIDAVLLGVGYNVTTNKFQLLLARAGNTQAIRMVSHDQITKLSVGPAIK